MKYEAVFGDDGLFFDAQKDCEMVGNGHHKVENGKLMVWNFSEKYWAESHTNKITIAAMRRIIKEPKRWTWEDKKAGVLPYAGTKVMQCNEYCTVDILSVHHGYIVVCNSDIDDSRPVSFAIEKFIELFNPIETPDEKAQREEDEFVNFVLHHSESKINSSEELVAAKRAIKLAYKLQLSGELQAPKGE